MVANKAPFGHIEIERSLKVDQTVAHYPRIYIRAVIKRRTVERFTLVELRPELTIARQQLAADIK